MCVYLHWVSVTGNSKCAGYTKPNREVRSSSPLLLWFLLTGGNKRDSRRFQRASLVGTLVKSVLLLPNSASPSSHPRPPPGPGPRGVLGWRRQSAGWPGTVSSSSSRICADKSHHFSFCLLCLSPLCFCQSDNKNADQEPRRGGGGGGRFTHTTALMLQLPSVSCLQYLSIFLTAFFLIAGT